VLLVVTVIIAVAIGGTVVRYLGRFIGGLTYADALEPQYSHTVVGVVDPPLGGTIFLLGPSVENRSSANIKIVAIHAGSISPGWKFIGARCFYRSSFGDRALLQWGGKDAPAKYDPRRYPSVLLTDRILEAHQGCADFVMYEFVVTMTGDQEARDIIISYEDNGARHEQRLGAHFVVKGLFIPVVGQVGALSPPPMRSMRSR
jgi:hypothetical protein